MWRARDVCKCSGGSEHHLPSYHTCLEQNLTVNEHVCTIVQSVLPLLDTQQATDVVIRLIMFVEESLRALAQANPGASAGPYLGLACVRIAPLVAAASDGVRRAAADSLTAVLRLCVTSDMVEAALVDAESGSTAQRSGLQRAVVGITALLGPGYHDCWPMALPVVAEMLKALGPRGAFFAKQAYMHLADLCRCAQNT